MRGERCGNTQKNVESESVCIIYISLSLFHTHTHVCIGGWVQELEMGKIMAEVNHGTASAYTGSKCRCDVCKAGWSKYQAARRTRIMAELAGGGGQHGTVKAYWAGCRCDVCKSGRMERRAMKAAGGA